MVHETLTLCGLKQLEVRLLDAARRGDFPRLLAALSPPGDEGTLFGAECWIHLPGGSRGRCISSP